MGCVIELKSITYAIKAREILRRNKIKATMEKAFGNSKKGCVYYVVVSGNCYYALELLKRNGIEATQIN